jgi:hypothetical protein
MPAPTAASIGKPQAVLVSSAADSGAGSLREALRAAVVRGGRVLIRFDVMGGPFGEPHTIHLKSPLPEIRGDVEIDGYVEGRLWRETGVTVSGDGRHRVFTVAPGGRLVLRSLTVASGRADAGGGILNRGDLVLNGTTLRDNTAVNLGGAVANQSGRLVIVNSTIAGNSAPSGGGVANEAGSAIITNATIARNSAEQGGAVFNSGTLLLRNSILADSGHGVDCVSTTNLESGSGPNLIETSRGCGAAFTSADPRLGELGYYNGPTQTMPLNGGSPAINFGDNAAALDEDGRPLRWDQRGNGDPRDVSGISDLGAFEVQVTTALLVDTAEDRDLRECTEAPADCSLRGAMRLANATPEPDTIRFDPAVFRGPTAIRLGTALPVVTSTLGLDASGCGPVTLRGEDGSKPLVAADGVTLQVVGVSQD